MILHNAVIFTVGKHNGRTYKRDDLASIKNAFDALGLAGRVPLKLGHEGPDVRDDPTTQFALGWVLAVRVDGDRLIADLDVPDETAELIRDGKLRFMSIELLLDAEDASGAAHPFVLDAVALLGTDKPAVTGVSDLRALAASRAPTTVRGTRVTLAVEGDDAVGTDAVAAVDRVRRMAEDLNDADAFAARPVDEQRRWCEAFLQAISALPAGRTSDELRSRVLRLRSRITERAADRGHARVRKLAPPANRLPPDDLINTTMAELREFRRELTEREARVRSAEALNEQLKEERAQRVVLTFEAAIARGECFPAAREQFLKRYGKAGTVVEALEWIKTSPRPPARAAASRSEASDETLLHRPDQALAARTREHMRRRWKEDGVRLEFADAAAEVVRLGENRAVVDAWRFFPGER